MSSHFVLDYQRCKRLKTYKFVKCVKNWTFLYTVYISGKQSENIYFNVETGISLLGMYPNEFSGQVSYNAMYIQ